jgi:glycosyltransferase involved in cell wall biosynthesis
VNEPPTYVPATPLISCIMPTYNRRSFIPLALHNFRLQDYPNRELIVIDDGTDPVADLVEGEPGVRYFRLPGRVTIGEKRSLACTLASGELIAHWDDDDWYSPERLSRQAEPILADRADLTGLVTGEILILPSGEFWAIQPWLHTEMFVGDIHGGTLMFRKRLIDEEVRYPSVDLAEDAGLLRRALARGYRLARLPNPGAFVYIRHGANTWRFETGRHAHADGWYRAERPPAFTAELVERYRTAAGTQ